MEKSYDELRSANLHENRRMLEELGVRLPSVGERVILNKPKLSPKRPNRSIPDGSGRSGARSFRVRLRSKNYQEEQHEYIYDPPKPRPPTIRPNPSYGNIPGVEVGREWVTRMECSYDLIHRPTVAGIHGGPDGAYSVALSGGYEDDIDFGESFTYTGEGGRDLKGTKTNPKNLRTAPQSKDQSLDRGNLALARSVETQTPVRVVRGYKLNSQYAPEEGYRYDGLYLVKKYWPAVGKSGFKVWKFAFIRCDSEPAPWVQTIENLGFNKSAKSLLDDFPRKRSISPEYLREDEIPDLKSPRTSSPQPSPTVEVKRRGRPKKSWISPGPFSADGTAEKRPRGRPRKSPLLPQSSPAGEEKTKKWPKSSPREERTETLTPPETSNSNRSSPTPSLPRSSPSPAGSREGSQPPVSLKADGNPYSILDNDEFPSDEEILSLMVFSLGACTSNSARITVKMVNGKWIEM